MSWLRLMLGFVVLLAIESRPAFSQDAPAPPRKDPLVNVLEKLREPVDLSAFNRTIKLEELPALGARFNISIVIGSELGGSRSDEMEQFEFKAPGKLPLGRALQTMLGQRLLTYLVRRDGIEIVLHAYAARVTRTPRDTVTHRLSEPLVSAVFVEKPLHEALASLADDFDATVVIAPQAGDARTGFVSARLLNVPLDKALELLALQSDLRVVREGNAFLVTSNDHANQMADQAVESEKRKAEIKQLRSGEPLPAPPAPAPAAPVPVAPPLG